MPACQIEVVIFATATGLIVHFVTKACVKHNPILSKTAERGPEGSDNIICLSMSLLVVAASLMNMWKCSHHQLTKQHQRQSFSSSVVNLNQTYKSTTSALCAESPWVSYKLYQVCVSLVITIYSESHSNHFNSTLCSLPQCTWRTYTDSYVECYYNNILGYKRILYTSAYVQCKSLTGRCRWS